MVGTSYLRFAKIAPFYDFGLKLLGLTVGGERRVRGAVLDLLPLGEGDRVLDVGCGTGTVSLMAAERVGVRGKVAGVDPSPQMLRRARKKVERRSFPQVEFLAGGGDSLPFPDASFDAAIFFLVIHEMAHPDRISSLREAFRLVKEGGYFVFGELRTPERSLARLAMRGLLVVEEEEARDFLARGLGAIVGEACGDALTEVGRVVTAGGLAEGVLYVRGASVRLPGG